MSKRVLITGASGLLGRAIFKEFCSEGSWEVLGLAFSRCKDKLKKVDITNADEVKAVFQEFQPSIVIHSAAERKPDVVENKPEATEKLNVEATRLIGQNAAAIGAWVLFISTDYVFDGKSPPYGEDATPNPLNKYGLSKREGEKVTLETSQENSVLRVPILYGDVEALDESAVTVLFDKVKDTSKTCIMSDYERRYPTHCGDIAFVIRQLADKRLSLNKNLANQRHMSEEDMKFCDRFLDELMSEDHQSYMFPFYEPLDPMTLDVYDYFDIVSKPMDLGTIKNNLECGLYKTFEEFVSDIRLIYHNCYLCFQEEDEAYKMAKQMENFCEDKITKFMKTESVQETNVVCDPKSEDNSIKGIYHWSGNENMTKYDMALAMAEVFKLPSGHIQADKSPSGGALRPYDAHLSCQRLTDLDIGRFSVFKEQIYEVLKPHFKS